MGLRLIVDGANEQYVAIVMGNAGVQRGLALYRGASLPKEVTRVKGAVPAGTLLRFLDPEGEGPPEFARKAVRYGWPADEALLPTWVLGSPQGPSDLSDRDARRCQIALAAVLAVDAQARCWQEPRRRPRTGWDSRGAESAGTRSPGGRRSPKVLR